MAEVSSSVFGNLVIIKRGGLEGQTYPLSKKVNTLGRNLTCDIRVQLLNISREHAKITMGDDGKLSVENTSVDNDTKVNGHPISGPQQLNDKDIITLGDRSFRLELPIKALTPLVERVQNHDSTPGRSSRKKVKSAAKSSKGKDAAPIPEESEPESPTAKAQIPTESLVPSESASSTPASSSSLSTPSKTGKENVETLVESGTAAATPGKSAAKVPASSSAVKSTQKETSLQQPTPSSSSSTPQETSSFTPKKIYFDIYEGDEPAASTPTVAEPLQSAKKSATPAKSAAKPAAPVSVSKGKIVSTPSRPMSQDPNVPCSTSKFVVRTAIPPMEVDLAEGAAEDSEVEQEVLPGTKRVTFGPDLLPQVFHKELPPSTPMTKGQKPFVVGSVKDIVAAIVFSPVSTSSSIVSLPTVAEVSEDERAVTPEPQHTPLAERKPTPLRRMTPAEKSQHRRRLATPLREEIHQKLTAATPAGKSGEPEAPAAKSSEKPKDRRRTADLVTLEQCSNTTTPQKPELVDEEMSGDDEQEERPVVAAPVLTMSDVKNKTPAKATPAKPADPFGALVEIMGNEIKANGPPSKKAPKNPRMATPLRKGIQEGVTLKKPAEPVATEAPAQVEAESMEVDPQPQEADTMEVDSSSPADAQVVAEAAIPEEAEATDAPADVEQEVAECDEEESEDLGQLISGDDAASLPRAPPPTPCAPKLANIDSSAPGTPSSPSPSPAKKSYRKLATPLRQNIQSKVSLKTRGVVEPVAAAAAPATSTPAHKTQLTAVEASTPQDSPQRLVDLKGLAAMMHTPQEPTSRVSLTVISSNGTRTTSHLSKSHSKLRPIGNKIPLPVDAEDFQADPLAVAPLKTPAKEVAAPALDPEAEVFIQSCLESTPEGTKVAPIVHESPFANSDSHASSVERVEEVEEPALSQMDVDTTVPSEVAEKAEVPEVIQQQEETVAEVTAPAEIAPVTETTPAEIAPETETTPAEIAPETTSPAETLPSEIAPEISQVEHETSPSEITPEISQEPVEDVAPVEKATRGRKRKAEEPEDQPKAKRAATKRGAKPAQTAEEPAAAPEEAPGEIVAAMEVEIAQPVSEVPIVEAPTKGRGGRKRAQTPVEATPVAVETVETQAEAVSEEVAAPKVAPGRRGRKPAAKEPTPEPVSVVVEKEATPTPEPEQPAERPTRRAARGRSKEPTPQPEPVAEVSPTLEPIVEEEPEEPVAEDAGKPKTRLLRGKRVQKLEEDPEPVAPARSTRGSKKIEDEEPVAKGARSTRSSSKK